MVYDDDLVSICWVLMRVMGNHEGDVYAAMNSLLFHATAHGALFSQDGHALHDAVSTFLALLRASHPDVYDHLVGEDVDIHRWARSWLRGLLVTNLTLPCLLRLWDIYLTESYPSSGGGSGATTRRRQRRRDRAGSETDDKDKFRDGDVDEVDDDDDQQEQELEPEQEREEEEEQERRKHDLLDLHPFVCLVFVATVKQDLFECDDTERILAVLSKLPPVDIDQVVAHAIALRDETCQ